MTIDDMLSEFRKLTQPDRAIFLEKAQNVQRNMNACLRAGTPVKFTTRQHGGFEITGVFIRMKQKYAEVESDTDRYGRKTERRVTWTVPPEALTVVG